MKDIQVKITTDQRHKAMIDDLTNLPHFNNMTHLLEFLIYNQWLLMAEEIKEHQKRLREK